MKKFLRSLHVRVCMESGRRPGLIAISSCAEPIGARTAKPTRTDATAPRRRRNRLRVNPHQVVTIVDDLAKLLEAASSGSGQERYTAIDDLGERAAESTWSCPILIDNLDESDPQVVWRSVRALGDYGEEAVAAAPKLRELLDNEDPDCAVPCRHRAGKVGDQVGGNGRCAGEGGRQLGCARFAGRGDRDQDIAPRAAKWCQALKKALAASDSAVAHYAIDAIVEHGAEAVPLLNESLKDPATAYLAAAAAEQIGPDAAGTVPALTAVLGKTKHSQLQIRVLLALGRIGPAAKSAEPQICR